MTIQITPNLKYTKGVRWLAEMYEQKQIDSLTAQTLNKLVDMETSRIRMQLEEIERVMADYERQYAMKTDEFFKKFDAGQIGDSMDFAMFLRKSLVKSNHEAIRLSRVGQESSFDRLPYLVISNRP